MNATATQLTSLLSAHVAQDAGEESSRQKTLAFLARVDEPCARSTLEGHLTASAVVLDPDARALLLFHARLELWVQPGGHIEPGEDAPTAALREAREESGLTDLSLERHADGSARLLDVDVHPIPAHPRKQEPAHWHYDLCFLARTSQPETMRIDLSESHDSRWVSAAELPGLNVDTATRRRLTKAFALAAGL